MEKDINEIIAKSLSGKKLNADEQKLMDQWIDIASNKGFYNKLFHYRNETLNVTKDKRMDVNQAYQKYLKHLSMVKSTKRKLFINRLLPYAAMLVVMAGVFSLMMYLGNDTAVNSDPEWLSSVEPGSQKAELILADGQVMSLEENREDTLIREQDGTLINNTGASLVYDVTSKIKNTEIAYNSLVVPRGGEYELVLEDGTKVKVNSETRLRYPTQFANNKRVVLLEGEAYFDVTKDKNRPFIVRTQGVDVKVLGTSFNVSSYVDEEAIRTTLVEGSVAVIDRNNEVNNVLLQPGYQAVYSKQNKELMAEKVNVELFTSWKDGQFVFDQSNLRDIMRRLSRWYDVKVFYQNSSVNNIRFTGSLKRYDSLDRLLNMIEKTNEVRFVVGNKTIQVERVFSKE